MVSFAEALAAAAAKRAAKMGHTDTQSTKEVAEAPKQAAAERVSAGDARIISPKCKCLSARCLLRGPLPMLACFYRKRLQARAGPRLARHCLQTNPQLEQTVTHQPLLLTAIGARVCVCGLHSCTP
jgi:hypothetical protein